MRRPLDFLAAGDDQVALTPQHFPGPLPSQSKESRSPDPLCFDPFPDSVSAPPPIIDTADRALKSRPIKAPNEHEHSPLFLLALDVVVRRPHRDWNAVACEAPSRRAATADETAALGLPELR